MKKANFRLSCDIGGTFSDFYLIDTASGEVDVEKCLTTPADPSLGVLEGVRRLAARRPGFLAATECVLHATTLVINAIIERKGARTGLLTTAGFRDVLEIGREMRYDLYDVLLEFPKPLVPRHLRQEVTERMYQDGRVRTPLDPQHLERSTTELRRHDVESIAVCFLHAYANPQHERAAAAMLARLAPDIPVSVSSDVLAEVKEYERTTTTVVNAYVKPLVARYTSHLVSGLQSLGFQRQLLIMLSSGGMTSAETAAEFPVRIVESGPAAGAVAAAYIGRLSGHRDDLLAFDMGGTTAKGCVIQDGRIDKAAAFEAARVHRFKKGSGIPLRIPVIDIMEIGAGGGSIARIDELGLIQVGPDSAGAAPGPACYGRGGEAPTVSDADLVLGYLSAGHFLGGEMPLDERAANLAIERRIAAPLGLGLAQAAWAIHELVTENMAAAIQIHMAEKGVDPGRFTLVAFGGAGPVHAYALARRLGIRRILVPPSAGIASAFGLIVSPISFDLVRTLRTPVNRMDPHALETVFGDMEAEGRKLVGRAEIAGAVTLTRSLDLCYLGQGYAVNVTVASDGQGILSREEVRQRFETAYERLYGRVYPDMEVELVNLRLVAESPAPALRLRKAPSGRSASGASKGSRQAYCAGSGTYGGHAVYDRYALACGTSLRGPAIIEERESTTVVGADGRVDVDDYGTLIITLPGANIMNALDGVRLEVLWTRFNAMADEAATALVRTAFSSIIRDANDYACALFDAEYNLFAQSSFGGPGFLGALPIAMKKIGEAYPPRSLSPGDVLITNDPWLCTGHLNDITVVTPVFVHDRLVAYAVCTAHETDIGGRIAIAETREVFEEGLFIPILKMFEQGEPNPAVFGFIRANVRAPDYVVGDLRAQLAANDVMAQRLAQLMAEYRMEDIQAASREILRRTEAAVRANIRQFPEGTYTNAVSIDTFDDEPIEIVIAVTLKDGEALIDYAGSSLQITRGVNVCLNYTRSYTTFAVKCAVSPLLPNNEGVLRPIKTTAPEGSILNARFPAPVNARSSVGQFLPEIVFRTLAPVMPERVIAGSGGAPVWAQRFSGTRKNGRRFLLTSVSRGGLGARPASDGVSTLAFPSNTTATPVEILEGDGPILCEKKELRRDSAGAGRFRGGFGQHMVLRVLEGELEPPGQVIASAKGGRFHYPVPGILGGHDAPMGAIIADGEKLTVSGKQLILNGGGTLELLLPGGGGYGDPLTRDLERVQDDLRSGLVSPQEASAAYGVVADASGWNVDIERSEELRALRASPAPARARSKPDRT